MWEKIKQYRADLKSSIVNCIQRLDVNAYQFWSASEPFIKYGTYAVLMFGFMYMSWHMGRHFEKLQYEGVEITECELQDDLIYACQSTRMTTDEFLRINNESCGKYKALYEEILRELSEPSHPYEWDQKYKEYQANEKVGL